MFLIFSFPLIFSKPIPPLTAISSYSLIHFLTLCHTCLWSSFPLFSSSSLSPIYHRSQYSHGPNLITTVYSKCLFNFSLYSSIQKFWLSLNLLSLLSLISSLSQHCSSPRISLQVCCSVNLLTLISSFNFCSHLHCNHHLHLLLLFLFFFSFFFFHWGIRLI